MLFNFTNYILEGIKEIDELYLLTEQILEYLSFRHTEIITELNTDGYMNYEMINMIYNASDYKLLIPFITKFTLNIEITNDMKSNNLRGMFLPDDEENYKETGWIFLNFDLPQLKQNIQQGYVKFNDKQQAFKHGLIKTYKEVLVHELQHAYDYYRTKGKFVNNKLTYDYKKDINKATDMNSITVIDNIFDENIQKKYFNLPHEIWARFTETINQLDLSMNFNDLLIDFKKKFRKFDIISDEQKKRVIKALYKYYNIKKGNI